MGTALRLTATPGEPELQRLAFQFTVCHSFWGGRTSDGSLPDSGWAVPPGAFGPPGEVWAVRWQLPFPLLELGTQQVLLTLASPALGLEQPLDGPGPCAGCSPLPTGALIT